MYAVSIEKTTTVVVAYIYLMSALNSQFCFPENLKNIAEIQAETFIDKIAKFMTC
jgi:hypothetical protein